jgi:hypothetical protein
VNFNERIAGECLFSKRLLSLFYNLAQAPPCNDEGEDELLKVRRPVNGGPPHPAHRNHIVLFGLSRHAKHHTAFF